MNEVKLYAEDPSHGYIRLVCLGDSLRIYTNSGETATTTYLKLSEKDKLKVEKGIDIMRGENG